MNIKQPRLSTVGVPIDRADRVSRKKYLTGITLTIVAAIAASTGGTLISYIESTDTWAILFFRSLSFTILVFLFTRYSTNGQPLAAYWRMPVSGYLAAPALGLAFVCYVFAMKYASVGLVLIILCTAPFIICVLQYIFLRQHTTLVNFFLICVAFLAIVLVANSQDQQGSALGVFFAFSSAICYSVFVVLISHKVVSKPVNSVLLAGVVATLLSLYFSDGLALDRQSLAIALVLGVFQIGGQYILIALASKLIKADQISLIMLLEVVLGPVLIWLFLSETIENSVLIAIPVVILCVVLSVLYGHRQSSFLTKVPFPEFLRVSYYRHTK